MGKRVKAKPKIINRLKKSESQIRKEERQIILRKLQQIVEEFYNENHDSSNSDCKLLLHTRNKRQTFPKTEFGHTKILGNKDDKYTCYRCKHFLQVPRNLSQPFCKRIPSFIAQCEVELSFIQAIVWLKSTIACVSQISIGQLQRIFNKQWNIRDNDNYRKNERIGDVHVERLRCSINKDLSIYEETTNTRDTTFVMSSPYNITTQRTIYESYIAPVDAQNKTKLSFVPTNCPNESPIQSLMPERYITTNKKEEKCLSRSCVIPEIDAESFSHSSNMFDENSMLEDRNEHRLELEEDARYNLLQTAPRNDIERVNKEITQDKNIFLTREEYANVFNKSILPMRSQYIESTLDLEYNFDGKCFTPMTSQYNLTETLASDDSPKSFIRNQINISQDSNVHNDNSFEEEDFEIDNKNSCTRMNDIAGIANLEHDSAYSTSRIEVFNYDSAIEAESITGNKYTPDTNTGCRYELRPRNKKTTQREEVTASPSIIQGARNSCRRQASSKRQFSSKENKSLRRAKNPLEKKETNKDDMISTNWLSFTLESLNVEDAILASVKVILSTICDKRLAEEYAMLSYWKDTLKEEAINAILNASDIFQMEKKPNICIKEIVTTIVKTLDEMMTRVELNEISIWILRIQIILELCNSLPVCVQIINHLIQKLKLFQSMLIDTMDVRQNTSVMISQLHLIFYALNIVVQKYRTIMPNDKKFAESPLPHVADHVWNIRYVLNEELEDAGLNLNTAEERWLNTLENFTVASTKCNFVQFAEKSVSLVHALISQSRV